MIDLLLPIMAILVVAITARFSYGLGIGRGRVEMKKDISNLTVRKMLKHKRNNFKDI